MDLVWARCDRNRLALVNIVSLALAKVVVSAVKVPKRATLHTFPLLELLLHPASLLRLHRDRFAVYGEAVHRVAADDDDLAVVYFMAFFATLEARQLVVLVRAQ